jgi:primosomal replication protein N
MFSSNRQKPSGIPDLDLQLSHSGNEQFRKVGQRLYFGIYLNIIAE